MRRRSMDPNLRRTLWGFAAVIILILVFAWIAFSEPLDANHPELAWRTMETEHFVIHYTEGSKRTALAIAKIAEEIYPTITGLYGYAPDTKFHFIVKDTDDYANGAAYYYNNKMLIWATPLDYNLRGTKNWLRDVITHEYTHVIQLGAARKLPRKIPAIYFQVLGYEEEKRPDVLYGYPNVLTSYPVAMTVIPMWFAEGVAQFNSPKFRYDFWDSHRDMQLRERALSDKLLTLNEMEVFGKNSIGSESVYNHGFSLVAYIARTYGVDKLSTLTREASKLGRWDFNAAIKRALGIDGEQLYQEWKKHTVDMYKRETRTIRQHIVSGKPFEEKGNANLFPLWSPDGKTLYYSSNRGMDYFSQRSIWKRSVDGGEAKIVAPLADGPFDISSDGNWLVYSKIVRQRNESYYADLYLRNLNTDKEYRLTRFARAMEPAFSPDMSQLVFVINHDGTEDIATMKLPSSDKWTHLKPLGVDEVVHLTDFNDGSRAYRPHFSADGKTILYAKSRDLGRDIFTMNLATREQKMLIGGPGDQRDPVWGPDGNWVYFAADETGIFNLYRYNLANGQREALTNVLGGSFMPSVRQDGELAYSEWVDEGYTIQTLADPSPVDPAFMDYGRNYLADLPKVTFNDTHLDTLPSHPYKSPFEQLFFVPRIAWDYGTFKPGVYVFSSDFLEKLMLFSGFDINKRGEFDAVATLEFHALRPTLFAEGYYLKRVDSERFEDPYIIKGEKILPDSSRAPEFDTYGVKYNFHLMEFDLGARMRLATPLTMELRTAISRYQAFLKYEDASTFQYTYFKGRYYQARFDYDDMVPMVKGNVNPRAGTRAQVTVAYEDNKFIEGFEINSTAYTLQEVFTPFRYWRFETDATHWYNPVGQFVVQPRIRAGYLDKQVDPFMDLYAGGLHGMRGYSFYSLGGTRKLIGSLALRHPLWTPDRPRLGWLHFDGLFAGLFGDVGDAWRERPFQADKLKRDIGLELRAKFYSWYGYPTAVTVAAARGLDRLSVTENGNTTVYNPQWRFYLTVLFDFETIFPERETTWRTR